MNMKLTLVACLAIMAGIWGETSMRMEREENFLDRIDAKVLTEFKDVQFFRTKRDITISSDCMENIDVMGNDAEKCFDGYLQKYSDLIFEDSGFLRDTSGETKPDYYARKTCNFITNTIQDCYGIMERCLPEGFLDKNKDDFIKKIVESTLSNPLFKFNPDKCPVSRDYYERNSAGSAGSLTLSLLLNFFIFVFLFLVYDSSVV
eukprot:GFUD01021362.1.p1 GENE.GFUD01021362.1~~GFUD01021362.1.p1  ORF type:complete len:204 (-),score=31.15 GFUD01021362.1:165-776(-)